jgi:hypothetical protein
MSDRIGELQGRVRKTRLALEGLAERTAQLRTRISEDLHDGRPQEGSSKPPGPVPSSDAEAAEAEDFFSDAWDIALINDEGK